jgi:hypothetical protein
VVVLAGAAVILGTRVGCRCHETETAGKDPAALRIPSVERDYHWTLVPMINDWPCQSLLADVPVAPVIWLTPP